MDWTGLVYEVVVIVFLGITSLAMQALFTYLKRKGIIEAIVAKEELAAIAVQFVEQAYYDLGGEAKYAMATNWLSEQLARKGLKVAPAEIRGLIESAVYEMQQAWFDVLKDE